MTTSRKNVKSPGGAVGECDFGANMCHINDSTGCGVLRCVNHELESNFHLVGNIFTADFIFTKTESTALSCASWARSPAYRADTRCIMITFWVAEGSTLYLVLVAY